jgi:hypothetical protein
LNPFTLAAAAAATPEKGTKRDPTEFAFVEQDEEGPELTSKKKKTATKKKKTRAPGFDAKNGDLFVIHSKGTQDLPSVGGKTVRINLAKLMMMRLTEEKVLEYVNLKDASGKPLTTDHFDCLIPVADSSHARFISVGKNTSNVAIHYKKQHPTVIEGLARLIVETPANQAVVVCVESS